MAQKLRPQSQSLYGLPQPISQQDQSPIVSKRDPTSLDTGYAIGQRWINEVSGGSWELTKVSTGSATWLSIGGTLTPTVATITATDFITTTANATTLSGNVWSGTGVQANIDLDLTPKGLGNVVVTNGDLEVAGGISMLTIGSPISIATGGVGAICGAVALVAGTFTFAVPTVNSNTIAFLCRAGPNGSPALGFLVADTSVNGNLTISSLDSVGALVATDTSLVNFICIQAD